jgi:hypothetical protein
VRDARLDSRVHVDLVDVRGAVADLVHRRLLDQDVAPVVPKRADHGPPSQLLFRLADVRSDLILAAAIPEDHPAATAGGIHGVNLSPRHRSREIPLVVDHLDDDALVVRPVEPADGRVAFRFEEEGELPRAQVDEPERAFAALLREHGDVRSVGGDLRGGDLRVPRVGGDAGQFRYASVRGGVRRSVLARTGQRGERNQDRAHVHGRAISCGGTEREPDGTG